MLDIFSACGFFVHTPFGPRKSGMPESVEMPAPVSTVTREAAASRVLANSMSVARSGDPSSMRTVLPDRRLSDAPPFPVHHRAEHSQRCSPPPLDAACFDLPPIL